MRYNILLNVFATIRNRCIFNVLPPMSNFVHVMSRHRKSIRCCGNKVFSSLSQKSFINVAPHVNKGASNKRNLFSASAAISAISAIFAHSRSLERETRKRRPFLACLSITLSVFVCLDPSRYVDLSCFFLCPSFCLH